MRSTYFEKMLDRMQIDQLPAKSVILGVGVGHASSRRLFIGATTAALVLIMRAASTMLQSKGSGRLWLGNVVAF